MELTRTSITRSRKRSLRSLGVILVFVFIFISIAISFWAVIAGSLDDDTRIEEGSELTYYLTVKYNGVDKYGVESTDTATSSVKSGIIEVTDRIPEGLTFIGFETTSTGRIGAVERSDDTVSCSGRVIDDTNEESISEGSWNADHTEFTYHGLHYYSDTQMVKFKTVDVQAGCNLTVGVITRAPRLNNAERIDFYNTGKVKEDGNTKDSNTVHTWIGRDAALVYDVNYSYTGDVPENAPALPGKQSYTRGSTVSVAMDPSLEGYEFSGWTTSDTTVDDNKFTMPSNSVNFVGIFTKKQAATKYTVTYRIDGDIPSNYIAPKEKTYEAGKIVNIDSTRKSSTIDDYVFSGWTSEDVTISENSFTMPENNVTITGSFTRQTYSVTYAFEGDVLPPNASSLLPATASYPAGTDVTLAANPKADGYNFSGWYSESTFAMPAKNLTIYGEWTIQAGTFSPTISISIPNQKDSYRTDQNVEFDIVVTNTAEFSITNVKIIEQLDNAKFVASSNYSISEERLATIPELAAGESITLKAQYTVTEDEVKEIANTVAIVGATASEENYNIDTTKDYTASVTFNTDNQQSAPVDTGIFTGNVALYVAILVIAACGIGVCVMYGNSAESIREKSSRATSKSSRRIIVGAFAVIAVSSLSVFFIGKVFAIPTKPISSVELISQNTNFANNEPGAWKVDKTAGWTGPSSARIIIDVESLMKLSDKDNDVILVVDNGKSMEDDRLQSVKDALTQFTNDFLDEGDNTLALITFNHEYQIATDFTNDRSILLSKISDISPESDKTNYYQGLNGVELLLRNYTESDSRNVTVVFLTDGAPNEELLYQMAEHWLIKNKYPFATINAIQYEMGDAIINELAAISDDQFVADKDSIADVVFDAAVSPYKYDTFILTDYINDEYFTISGADAISVNKGTTSLEYDGSTPKIIWNMNGKLRTKSSARMEIDISLKDEYVARPGLYPTNKSTSVKTTLRDTASENVATNNTPILRTDYKVTYVANAPSDCEVSGIPGQETHFVYTIVEIANTVPTCSGYSFAGYEIVEDQVTKLNDDYFRMPEKDVTIGATWTKVDLNKRMDGTVHVAKTLYDTIAKRSLDQGSNGAYNTDSDIDFSVRLHATGKQGAITVASTINDEYPIHYFRGAVSNNNVLFADICWKAMRTTNTGGVKLVYNGEVDSNRQCDNSRSTHSGYSPRISDNLTGNYYYGTDYTYNEATQTFSLSGVKTLAKWDDTTDDSLVGQYTCKSTDQNASCAIMYLVESKRDTVSAYVLPLKNTTPYHSIGVTQYNEGYNAPIGYMYGAGWGYKGFYQRDNNRYIWNDTVLPGTTLDTNYYYADTMTYGTDEADKYSLVDPYQVSSSSDYADLVGKYTFRASQSDYRNNTIYYIVAVDGSSMYYLEMKNGQTLSDVDTSYMIGDSFTDNGNGTYTLNNPSAVKKTEWGANYTDFKGKFTCGNNTNTTCSKPLYIQDATAYSYSHIEVTGKVTIAKARNGYELLDALTVKIYELSQNPSGYSEYKYTCGNTSTTCTSSNLRVITSYTETQYSYAKNVIFGANAEWDGANYNLTDTLGPESYGNSTDISTHHYVCPTIGQTTCNQVYYIYSIHSGSYVYVTLSGGMSSPNDALEKMRENKTNSVIKNAIDAWYAHTLTNYAHKIEDTQYCNDRSIYDLGGWNPNGGMLNQYLRFGAYGRNSKLYQPSLDCPNNNDAFTVDSANGNGKLTYPVGLLTEDELTLAGHGTQGYSVAGCDNFRNTYLCTGGGGTWSMSPATFDDIHSYVYAYRTNSPPSRLDYANFVRPVISIAPGTLISNGDGSVNRPWVLE